MMSELGRETVSAYAAAKGGLKMLTKNICSEYGEYNIQCNGIGPGYIATPQTAPPVSYTHLDVYKRQGSGACRLGKPSAPRSPETAARRRKCPWPVCGVPAWRTWL